jgi:hypothetical protein
MDPNTAAHYAALRLRSLGAQNEQDLKFMWEAELKRIILPLTVLVAGRRTKNANLRTNAQSFVNDSKND